MKAANKKSSAHIQDAPFCVQIEPTEGCNLRCDFCGLRTIRSKCGDYKFMSLVLAEGIAQGIASAGWSSRIEFAMHGEPTMNPNLTQIVATFRKFLPYNQLMVTSNGGGLVADPKRRIDALFHAGLNVLALDDYMTAPYVTKIRAALVYDPRAHDYPLELRYSPQHRYPKNTNLIIYMEDIQKATKGGHAKLVNHCGAAAPLNDSKAGQRCARPFRELSIRWNGKVAACCNDFRGALHVGDVVKDGVWAVWHNTVFNALRRKLYVGERDFVPCKGCDATTYRNGLLPDKNGRQTLRVPNTEDIMVLRAAAKGIPYAFEK